MKKIGLWLVWSCAGLVLIGFLMPWIQYFEKNSGPLTDFAVRSLAAEEDRDYWRFVTIPAEERKRLFENPFSGKSGFSLWKSWRLPEDPLPGADLFASKRSLNGFWIFAVPASALLGAFFYTMTRGWGPFVGMVISLGTYLTLRWNLQETFLDRLVSGFQLGWGLWICLYGLLILSFCLSIRWILGLSK